MRTSMVVACLLSEIRVVAQVFQSFQCQVLVLVEIARER